MEGSSGNKSAKRPGASSSSPSVPPLPQLPRKTPPSASGGGKSASSRNSVKREDLKSRKSARRLEEDAEIEDGKMLESVTTSLLSEQQVIELLEVETVEDSVALMAGMLNMDRWREDMHQNILLGFHHCNLLLCKNNGVSAARAAVFLGIMKGTLERSILHEDGPPLAQSLKLFRYLVLNNLASGHEDESLELKALIDHTIQGFFQHYRLYQHVFSTTQESMEMDLAVTIEKPIELPPLSEAITLEEYEEEQARIREQQMREKLEQELREPELLAATNPFAILSADDIREIANEAIVSMIKVTAQEFETAIEEQRTRFMGQLGKLAVIN